MSHFGPPGAPPDPFDSRPGAGLPPPTHPRHARGEPPADERYAPTAPGYEPPAQRYAPSAGWEAEQSGPGHHGPPYPEPPRPKRGKGRLVAGLAVVVVLLLVAAAAFWVFVRKEPTPGSGPGAPAGSSVDPSAGAEESVAPATTAAAPASSTDPRFVRAGQCVRNDGAVAEPKLVITECAPKTYEVLSRIEGPTSGKRDAEAKCAQVAGYTDWFFYNSELDTLDFVLCLKRR